MNKKKLVVILSFVFLFVFGYLFVDVNANEASACTCQPGDYLVSSTVKDDGSTECVCEDLASNAACQAFFDSNGDVNVSSVFDKYKPVMDDLENGSWQISIDPSDPNDSSVLQRLRNVRFKLYSINNNPVTYDAFVSYDYPLVVNTVTDAEGYMTLVFVIDKEHPDPDCISEELRLEMEIMDGGDARIENPDLIIPENTYGSGNATSRSVDCNNQIDAFDRAFCTAKAGAKAKDPRKTLNINFEGKFNNGRKFSDLVGAGNYTKFSCDSSSIYVKNDDSTNYYMSANTSYMYGSGERVIDAGDYIYNFWCGNTSSSNVSCKIKCEEAVTIQYGAPIASKAGLCFEYKVKVTSNVSCTMVEAPPQPHTYPVCTPSPTCTGIGRNGNRYYLTQGGPNEDFHRCVESCDGGKYTSKCSKQCYKQVYQNSLISYTPKKNASNYNCSCSDCYRNPSTWSGGGPGRWYGGSCNPGYVVRDNGFCRHDYGGGRICQDTCWWSGCEGNNYLNPEARQADATDNWTTYYSAISQCQAAASCSTSTAEFTISVDYKDGSNTVKSIDFPYSTNALVPDFAKYNGGSSSSSSIDRNNTTLLGIDGCYNRPANNSVDFYATEWGFPGSWINRKTGELSYKTKSGESNGWQFISKKFCIPFDAKDVNINWWNYYYTKLNQLYPTKYLAPKCPQNSVPTVEDSDNIRAKAKNFGYYGWNIEVDCFYALNDTEKLPCDPPEPGDPNDEIKYVIRSIDLEDVFPNVSGEQLVVPESEVGREPGFNWSSAAYNEKNLNYVSAPLDYALRIQELGYSIYSDDDQLDYKFRLSPAVLNELKRQRSSDYTSYLGDNYTDDKGVIRYKSRLDLLDDSSITLKKPNAAALQCNNMIGRNACEAHARH